MTFITFLRKLESFLETHQLIMLRLKLSELYVQNIWFQTYFSQYQTTPQASW